MPGDQTRRLKVAALECLRASQRAQNTSRRKPARVLEKVGAPRVQTLLPAWAASEVGLSIGSNCPLISHEIFPEKKRSGWLKV